VDEIKHRDESIPDDSNASGQDRQLESTAIHTDATEPVLRRKYLVPGAIVLAGLLVAAAFFWQRGGGESAAAPAHIESAGESAPSGIVVVSETHLKQVTVEPVIGRRTGAEREATGRVGFNEDRVTPVFTPASGHIVELRANKGDVVRAGQVLAVIESPEVIAAQNELAAARADEAEASTNQDVAREALQRAQSLAEREAISSKELRQAEADYARAKVEQHRTRAAVRVAENRLQLYGKTAEEIEKLADLGRKYEGSIDNRLEIRAPIGGTIVERKVGPGQHVKSDTADAMFLISDLSTLWVLGDVYESYLSQVQVGAPVSITVDAYPDRNFPARVSFINPTFDPSTRTIHVRCVVENKGNLLRPEMFARINIGALAPSSVPVVPSSAVITLAADSFVFVERSSGRFERRAVRVGQEVRGLISIEEGLSEGERVATRGALLLNELGKPKD
jgi:cobalt-zinc-cadmium efflux system membrane fusion protein